MNNYVVLSLVAVGVIAILAACWWYSTHFAGRKINQLRQDQPGQGLTHEGTDPLIEQHEPALDLNKTENVEADGHQNDFMPASEPPVYEEIEKEREEAAQTAALASDAAPGSTGMEAVPADGSVHWVLTVTPDEGRTISFGAVSSLVKALKNLHYQLPIEVYARSKRNNLFYPAQYLPSEALEVVVTAVLINRVERLNAISASRIRTACETLATDCDAELTTSMEIDQIESMVENNKNFIDYFNRVLDLLIVTRDGKAFDDAQVNAMLSGLGFEREDGFWTLKTVPYKRDGEITVRYTDDAHASLTLRLDLMLCNPARGDVARLFAMANHAASHLGAQWSDSDGNPLTTSGALQAEGLIAKELRTMARYGVPAGSDRAFALFGKGA